MVGANKILTVSYGTFSCTLEGFDDSFDTMKAIAEYFRDLAADDRYFGAEPPTPDAEMLQRIAEREVRKRVEARVEDDGIVLRTETDAPMLPVAEAQPAPAPMAAPAAAPASSAPAAQPHGDSGSVAAKLARIRAVVDNARAAASIEDEDFGAAPASKPEATALAPEAPAPVAEDPAPESVTEEAPVEIAPVEEAPVAEIVAAAEPIEEAEPVEELVSDVIDEADIAEIDTPEADAFEAAPDDTAEADEAMDFLTEEAILSAIADDAEVAGDELEPEPEAMLPVEDTAAPAEDDTDLVTQVEDEADSSFELAAGVLKLVSEEDAEAEQASFEEDSISAAEQNADTSLEDDLDADTAFEEDDEQPLILNILSDDSDDAETEEAVLSPADDAEPESDLGDENDDAAEAPEDAPRPASASILRVDRRPKSDAAKRALERARARVLKVKGTEDDDGEAPAALSQALGFDTVEDEITQDAPAETEAFEEELSAEDEADLLAELAANETPEAEIADDTADETAAEDDTPEAVEPPVAETASDRRGRLKTSKLEEEEVAVSRLLEETNSKLDGPEHRRRRSAIAHLKAAVAATVAERRLKPSASRDAEAEAEKDAYRQDLAEVVRPSVVSNKGDAPTAETAEDAAPDTPRMPPLMLVSEQRVDPAKSPSDKGVVRPRRVTKGNLALKEMADEDQQLLDDASDDGDTPDFATFAADAGVEDPADIMEAAAAYLVTHGEETFTRPQIMKLVSEYHADGDEFGREDGLRAFGTLLRLGKIEKIKRGQFTISQTSRFMR